MQAPRLDGLVFIFFAGVALVAFGLLIGPPILAFIVAFVVFDLSLAASKVIAIWVLVAWILVHAAFWSYTWIHDKIAAHLRKVKHKDFTRIRNIFYFSNALCFENYEALVERERKWKNGEGIGRNLPHSDVRCESELRNEVGSWLSAGSELDKR